MKKINQFEPIQCNLHTSSIEESLVVEDFSPTNDLTDSAYSSQKTRESVDEQNLNIKNIHQRTLD